MIIGHDLMVQLVLLVDFKCKVLQQDGITVPMKEPIDMIGKSDLTSHEMSKVDMQTAESAFTREATERLVRILDSTYKRANRQHATHDATHLNADERTQSLRLLEYFQELFDVAIGYWDTEPVDLQLKPYYEQFYDKYNLVPRINKDNFCKELKRLVKIGALTPVQKFGAYE